MIEVILLERVERLGQLGQVVKVRPGFARNFLLPQNKALRATKANLEHFEKERASLEAKNVADRSGAEAHGKKLEGKSVIIVRQASETGQLYGSVSARDISDAAKEAGQEIQKAQVQIDAPIKTIGIFQIKVKLHPEVMIKLTVNIARSADEARVQAEKGAAAVKAEAAAAAEQPFAANDQSETEAKPAKKAKGKAKDDTAADEGDEAPKAKKPRAKKASEG
jgi:large subunit ribosomal protein L9